MYQNYWSPRGRQVVAVAPGVQTKPRISCCGRLELRSIYMASLRDQLRRLTSRR